MKRRSQNNVQEIADYVARGYSQSAANRRVLLDEIGRLRAEIARIRRERNNA